MSFSQQTILIRVLFIFIAAVVCRYLGVPEWMILLGVGYLLLGLLLYVFWVKNSIERSMVQIGITMMIAFVLISYFFKVSFLTLLPGVILMLAALFLKILWVKSYTAKSRERLAQWAAENGWQLLEFEHRLNTGPFGGFIGKAQLYFEFVICDRRKKRHTGWAHFNYGLFGRGRFQVKKPSQNEK